MFGSFVTAQEGHGQVAVPLLSAILMPLELAADRPRGNRPSAHKLSGGKIAHEAVGRSRTNLSADRPRSKPFRAAGEPNVLARLNTDYMGSALVGGSARLQTAGPAFQWLRFRFSLSYREVSAAQSSKTN